MSHCKLNQVTSVKHNTKQDSLAPAVQLLQIEKSKKYTQLQNLLYSQNLLQPDC